MRYTQKKQHIPDELPRPDGISGHLAALLYARGAEDEAAMRAFLHPDISQLTDPMRLKDMDFAAARIKRAIDEKQRIVIYGDYDTDGVCATAMLFSYLTGRGADVGYKTPNRQTDGYGMNIETLKSIAQDGTKLIVTVDNGVRAHAEVACALELGMDVVVTDHHRCTDTLPAACAVVCPSRPDGTGESRELCGAGVVLKLIQALGGEDAMREHLPLAALATMADVVPVLDENRAIVALGLAMINRGECCCGLKALSEAAGRRGALTGRDLAFSLAPRLNAAYRMEDATQCVKLLCTEDAQEAGSIAARLDELNALRQKEESDICASACAMVEAMDITGKYAIVLRGSWNPGVVGIAAARLAERYHRPTVLLCEKEGILTGSARSIKGMDLYAALTRCEDCFTRFGGHAYAAGMTLYAERFDEFVARVEKAFSDAYPKDALVPEKTYEAELALKDINMALLGELRLLEPFGEGNPRPLFRTPGVLLTGLRRVGANYNHINCTAVQQDSYIEAVGFGMGDELDALMDYERADVLYAPDINEYRGRINVQLRLTSAKPCTVKEPEAYAAAHAAKFTDAISRNIIYNNTDICSRAERTDPAKALLELLDANYAGVLLLCFTAEGVCALLNSLCRVGFSEDVPLAFCNNRRGPAAYHTVVAAPVLDRLDIARYRHIVVYDTPVFDGMLARLAELAPDARLYTPERPMDASAAVAPLLLDRDGLIPYYRAMAKESFYNRAAAEEALSRRMGKPQCVCALALDIMQELELISGEGGIRLLPDAKKRELAESGTFRALGALRDKYSNSDRR